MSDSKLPQVRPNTTPASLQNALAVQQTSTSPVLTGTAVSLGIAALVVYFVTHSMLFTIILGLLSLAVFVARQLVLKSVDATSQSSSSASTDPTTLHLQEMRKQVSKCKFLENVEDEGTRAALQAQQLFQQYTNLQVLLRQKFEPGEITYSRYKDSIDDTCLAIGENLLHLKNLLESLNIQNLKVTAPAAWTQQNSQVHEALESNAAALAELTVLHTSLNEITTKETHRDQLEQSLQQIRDLAERAKQYSKQ